MTRKAIINRIVAYATVLVFGIMFAVLVNSGYKITEDDNRFVLPNGHVILLDAISAHDNNNTLLIDRFGNKYVISNAYFMTYDFTR